MGTRSLTFVHDGTATKPFMCMYRQMDGYPSGHGAELAGFLSHISMVNGFRLGSKDVANGAGCLAAQIVSYFKDGPGGIYLYPATSKDADHDYEYHVYADEEIGIRVKVFEMTGLKFVRRKALGDFPDVASFAAFCKD